MPRNGVEFAGANEVSDGVSVAAVFTMELVLTFMLVFVIFATAVDKRLQPIDYASPFLAVIYIHCTPGGCYRHDPIGSYYLHMYN